jgi:hypothetical protein
LMDRPKDQLPASLGQAHATDLCSMEAALSSEVKPPTACMACAAPSHVSSARRKERALQADSTTWWV